MSWRKSGARWKPVTAAISVAAADTAGVTAHLELAHEVSDYDYIAIAIAGSGADSYVTYEYNADKTRRGTVRVAHTSETRAATRLVLRYYDAHSKLLAESAPFAAPPVI